MRSILIVDDNHMFRRTMKRILNNHVPGCRIREAADGEEALRQVDEQEPDLILMDIHLPDENGLKVTEKIKADNPGSRILFITGYDQQEYRDAASRIGADGFLSKNRASPEEMVTAIESILKNM
jgi:two-component system response regulator YesN